MTDGGRFSRDGVSLHYETAGAGDAVVLLHGFTTSLAGNWRNLGWFDLLTGAGLAVAALDFRSHGLSDRVYDPRLCTTAALAGDVVALLDHLELERASLIGFSMGGGVALQVAIDRPERVEKVVVGGVGDAALDALHDPDDVARLVTAFEAPALDDVPPGPARAIRRNAELAGADLRALVPFLRNGGWPGGIAERGAISSPVLVVVAGRDEYMAETGELLRWLGHAQTLVAPERGHHDVLGDPAVQAGVVRFLRGG